MLEFDKKRKEPAFMAKDYWLSRQTINAEKTNKGTIRIMRDDLEGTVGNILVFGASGRYHPAFTLENCDKINIFEQFKQRLNWSDEEAMKNIRVI